MFLKPAARLAFSLIILKNIILAGQLGFLTVRAKHDHDCKTDFASDCLYLVGHFRSVVFRHLALVIGSHLSAEV